MSRLRLEEGVDTLVDQDDVVLLGPLEMDLKSRDTFRFTGNVVSGKVTFKVMGSLTETAYPGTGDWAEIKQFSASDLEGVAFVENEYPYIVVLASPTVLGIQGTARARVSHLIGGDVGDFDALAIAGGVIPGKSVETILFDNDDVRVPWEDIWDNGGTRIQPTAPTVVDLYTYHVDDGFGGAGANVAVIEGVIDNAGSHDLFVESVPLVANGMATSVNSFVMVHRIAIVCGANQTNTDVIEAYQGSDIQLRIRTDGSNLTHASHFYVPDNHQLYISQLELTSNKGKRLVCELQNFVPGLNCYVSSHPIYLDGGPVLLQNLTVSPFQPRNIIKLRARNLTGGRARISGRYTAILEELP